MPRWGTGVAAAVLAAAVAGCGSGAGAAADSSPLPITASSTSPSAPADPSSTSASGSVDPTSDAAILAAVHAYAAGVTSAGRTATIAPVLGVADASCPCVANVKAVIGQLQAANEHLDAVVLAKDIQVISKSTTNADVKVDLATSAYHVLSDSGQVIQSAPANSQSTTLSLNLRGSTWIVFYAR